MGKNRTETAAGNLNERVRGAVTPAQAATQGEHERHRWIEVRTAQRAQKCNQNRKHRNGRARVRDQGDCVVVRQAFSSNTGADDGSGEHGTAESFRK